MNAPTRIGRGNGRGSIAALHSGRARGIAKRRAKKALGMAAAIEWRESRRCHCGALAFESCAHRPEGLTE